MSLHVSRRSILVTASAVLGTTAGCVESGRQATSGSQSETESDRNDDGRTSTGGTTKASGERADDIYLDNESERERVVSVTVTADDDRTHLSRRYRIPANTRIQFADVGKVGQLYTVAVSADDQLQTEFTWRILSCAGDEGSSGDTDAEIDIFEDRLRFRKNECDLIAIDQHARAENASKYRIESSP